MDENLQTILSAPSAVAVAFLAAHLRFNRIEDRLDTICQRLGVASPQKKRRWKNALLVVVAIAGLAFILGCAQFKTTMTETSPDGTVRETQTRITALGDTKQIVDKLRVSHGKTQSIGANVEQETATTNALSALMAIDSILGKLRP